MTKVIVRISQGLANRMFQVAYALSLKQLGYEVEIDYCRNNKFAHEFVELGDIFKIDIPEASKHDIEKFRGTDTKINKILRRIPIISSCRIIPFSSPYKDSFSSYSKDSYVIGTFQSQNFFNNVMEQVRTMYKFPSLSDLKNIELANRMANENSIAIHVRKGADYKKDILANTCTVDYYQKAIAFFKTKVSAPVFYVFTDNQNWVVNNIVDCDYTLIDWNPRTGKLNYLDMQLMSLARHNIIANSTYSWWSAWLNPNPGKIVIAPDSWYNPKIGKLANIDIVPNEWIKF